MKCAALAIISYYEGERVIIHYIILYYIINRWMHIINNLLTAAVLLNPEAGARTFPVCEMVNGEGLGCVMAYWWQRR